MAAHGDDLRYFYAEDIGETIELAVPDATSTQLRTEALQPGRYALRIVTFGAATSVWVSQGVNGSVTAAAAAPSMQFVAHNEPPALNWPVLIFMVRASGVGRNPADQRDQLAFYAEGSGATVQVTKISRDLR